MFDIIKGVKVGYMGNVERVKKDDGVTRNEESWEEKGNIYYSGEKLTIPSFMISLGTDGKREWTL